MSDTPWEPLVHLHESAGGVWRLLLDSPPVNAMSEAMYEAILRALDHVEQRDDFACLMVGSSLEGKFCGGADTNGLAELKEAAGSARRWEEHERLVDSFVARSAAISAPTVAVVDGYAVGAGFVLASQCDLRVVSDRAWFSIPELSVDRCGGARHALRVLPQAIVRSMYFQGVRLDARRAYDLGFVNEVVAPEELWSAAENVAAEIARHAPSTLRLAKTALNRGQELTTSDGYQLEALYSFRLANYSDAGE